MWEHMQCVHVCMCGTVYSVQGCAHTCVWIHESMYVCWCECVRACIYAHIWEYVHVCTCLKTCTYVIMCVHACICESICTRGMCMCGSMCIHTSMYTYILVRGSACESMCKHVNVCECGACLGVCSRKERRVCSTWTCSASQLCLLQPKESKKKQTIMCTYTCTYTWITDNMEVGVYACVVVSIPPTGDTHQKNKPWDMRWVVKHHHVHLPVVWPWIVLYLISSFSKWSE